MKRCLVDFVRCRDDHRFVPCEAHYMPFLGEKMPCDFDGMLAKFDEVLYGRDGMPYGFHQVLCVFC